MCGIYMYEHKASHKKYIGRSTDIAKRKSAHKCRPSSCSLFDETLAKEGEDAFIFSVLEECTPDKLDEREKYWIHYYNCLKPNGYNILEGGNCYIGENNPWSKLTENQVKEIITLLEECKLTNKEIANLYNVIPNTIDSINNCHYWTHLHSYKSNIRQENLNKKTYPCSIHAGENNPTSKITEEKALEIIELLKYDSRSLAKLSRELDISLNILYDINRCKTWKHLHNYKSNVRNEARKEVVPI